MEINKVSLSFTEDELITIHTALEVSVKASIAKYPEAKFLISDLKEEIDLLWDFRNMFGYKCSIWPEEGGIKNYKTYDDVDEWVKALIKIEKARQNK